MRQLLFFTLLLLLSSMVFSLSSNGCCAGKGGVCYCDSSAGRLVCSDGDYSSCYCTRHAVMDLQKIKGCCTWKGGVLKVDEQTGLVICNNGGISEMCSEQAVMNRINGVQYY